MAIGGIEGGELVFHGDHEDPPIGDGRTAVHGGPDLDPPDHLAALRIEGDNLAIAGRHIEAVLGKGKTAAKGVAEIARGPQIDLPQELAVGRGIGADLDAAVHRIDAAAGNDRLRHHPAIARGALADADPPGLG